jgi:nicotinate phosphoribosyltransferase
MRHSSGLLTDLYELTMAAGYFQTGFEATATFELFVRNLPPRRSYLVAAGLEQALDYLENVRFSPEEIDYLRRHPAFGHVHADFFDYLARFRFTGEVHAMREGTLVFPGEPILRVTAPAAEGQIVETFLLAAINFQTLVASKAARVVTAAGHRPVIEFGTRRAHGIESGVLAARAAFIGGCQGTSNVYAGRQFGIPTFGTLAHSFIMAHESEEEAFHKFLDVFPEHAILLVDTYDVRAAVEKVIQLGRKPRGVRLDSGDLVAQSRWVRERLGAAGWADVQVFASGDLDEDRIDHLLSRGAQIDGFGVGTALATSADAPSLGVIYKLVEIERDGRVHRAAKFSEAKITYPGRKQVFRFFDAGRRFESDVIGLEGEEFPHSRKLLECVMRGGKRLDPSRPLDEVRRHCVAGLERLPDAFRRLHDAAEYPVRYSEKLESLLAEVRGRLPSHSAGPPR